jgi:MSHA biogenesis protein MshL
MSKNIFTYIKLFLLSLIFIFICTSCKVTPPPSSNVNGQIVAALQDGLRSNQNLPAKSGKAIPGDIQRALLPEVSLSGASKKTPEQRFDLAVDNVPAKDFFTGLVKDTPYNITVSDDVKGMVSVSLKNVTIQEALDAVRDMYGYDYQVMSYGYEILPKKLETRMYSVDYLNINRVGKSSTTVNSGQISSTIQGTVSSGGGSTTTQQSTNRPISTIETDSTSNFWKQMKDTLELLIGTQEGRSVVINPESGLVMVRAYPDELDKVGQYLDSMQNVVDREVIIEAKILEVELDSAYQTGIQWKLFDIKQDGTPPNLDTSVFNSVFTLGAGINVGDVLSFDTVIKLLSSQGKVYTLSSPRLTTMNNQKAVIKVGEDEFFVTNVSTQTNTGTTTDTVGQNIDLTPFFSGISLDVTPQIDNDGDVILHIHPLVSSVKQDNKKITINNKEQDLPLAKSKVRESDNIVRAKNGQLVVIGGLMENGSFNYQSSTPGVDNIPTIGGLFKNSNRGNRKFELIILLRPTIADRHAFNSELKNVQRRIDNMPQDFGYVLKGTRMSGGGENNIHTAPRGD